MRDIDRGGYAPNLRQPMIPSQSDREPAQEHHRAHNCKHRQNPTHRSSGASGSLVV
jgi:hypothetical protein